MQGIGRKHHCWWFSAFCWAESGLWNGTFHEQFSLNCLVKKDKFHKSVTIILRTFLILGENKMHITVEITFWEQYFLWIYFLKFLGWKNIVSCCIWTEEIRNRCSLVLISFSSLSWHLMYNYSACNWCMVVIGIPMHMDIANIENF